MRSENSPQKEEAIHEESDDDDDDDENVECKDQLKLVNGWCSAKIGFNCKVVSDFTLAFEWMFIKCDR